MGARGDTSRQDERRVGERSEGESTPPWLTPLYTRPSRALRAPPWSACWLSVGEDHACAITSGHYSIFLLPIFFFTYYSFAIRWCTETMLSLKDLCVRVIYHNSLFSSLYILPVELMDQVFQILARMSALTDSHLVHWKHTQAKDFDFSNCKYITDHGIKDFVQRFSFMESLRLGESGITTQCISHIASYCTNMRTLDISDVAIKESDFNSLRKSTSLRHLVCRKNSGLKAKGISKLLTCWPGILSVILYPILPKITTTSPHPTHYLPSHHHTTYDNYTLRYSLMKLRSEHFGYFRY